MLVLAAKFATVLILALLATGAVCGQDASDRLPGRPTTEFPIGMKEMLAKQRIARDRKQFKEMQDRADEALRLSKYLDTSFQQNQTVSANDRDKLVELERIVEKIREELGGDDADDADQTEGVDKPNSIQEALKSLKETTVSLVDEIKKTTRFTISAAAIQTSNSALKIIRFLRLKR
ncbi:MAG TPA: hypothetical protein VJL58_06450 [Pyrinomonadaceae bacterium]|nr:hypothetical protein [Pyrinomonadaceae bacterium]